jgi:ABC-type transport system involved in multi-copper enzyme maturation permease subunit
MSGVLKIELRKAFGNKLFLLTLAVGIVIASISAYQNIQLYLDAVAHNAYRKEVLPDILFNPMYPAFSPYTYWIGGDYQYPMTSLFYLLLPLMASLAFGWSFFMEKKSGYIKNVVTRTKKTHYFLAKYIAVFLSGGAVIAIPLVINFLTVACFIPAYQPDIYYNIYYSMHYHFLSELFYSSPLLYVIYVMALDFVFSGLIATASMALTFFVRNRFAVVLLPFLLLLGIQYIQDTLYKIFQVIISPIDFLKAYSSGTISGWVVFPFMIILFLLTFGITCFKGVRDDVF